MAGYEFSIDGDILPVTPAKITWTIDNKNETVTTVDGLVHSVLHKPGLTKITFDIAIPAGKYNRNQIGDTNILPYSNVDTYKDPTHYIRLLNLYKTKRKSMEFVISGGDLDSPAWVNGHYTLEDYEIVQDAEDGSDFVASVTLQQYQPLSLTKLSPTYLTKTRTVTTGTGKNKKKKTLVITKKNVTRPDGVNLPVTPKTITLKADTNVKMIAKQYYGDTSYAKYILNGNLRSKTTAKGKTYYTKDKHGADFAKGEKVYLP